MSAKDGLDTIVALSSASPEGGAGSSALLERAILRLSGPRALACAARVFKPSIEQNTLENIKGWRRIAGSVRWPSGGGTGRPLPCAAYVMRAPRSYTREDVVELHLPGLRWLVSSLLEELLRAGARLAQPGEFTRRAYEHGRIGLGQAQAVGALIQAASADEARAHAARLRQRAPRGLRALRAEIEALLALVELGLDFATEDVEVLPLDEMRRRIERLCQSARELSGKGGQQASGGSAETLVQHPRIVLAGPSNAGKSSLFNALLGRAAALVAATRHTTRDRVEALLALEGPPGAAGQAEAGLARNSALLIDTAGAGDMAAGDVSKKHAPVDWLRQAGWQMSLAALRAADILLLAIDRSAPLDARDWIPLRAALEQARPAAALLLWTKADLPRAQPAAFEPPPPLAFEAELHVSAHSGSGLKELRAALHARVSEIGSRARSAAAVADAAGGAAAEHAAVALERAAEALRLNHGEDAVAVELREALHACWRAEGILIRHDAVTEDMLDRIFAQFCIGK